MTDPYSRLATQITAFSSFASRAQVSYARKALQRIEETLASAPCPIEAHVVATCGLKDKYLSEERAALRWATGLPRIPTEILDRIDARQPMVRSEQPRSSVCGMKALTPAGDSSAAKPRASQTAR